MAGSKLTMRAHPAFLLLVFFVLAGFQPSAMAQRKFGGSNPLDTLGEEVSQKKGWEILQKFRQLWQPSGYRYHFELKHNPRRGSSRYVPGTMIGTENERGIAMRLDVLLEEEGIDDSGQPKAAVVQRYLLQSGLDGYAMELRSDEEGAPEEMSTEEQFAPIAGTEFSVFDLRAPYIFWQGFVYEGRTTLRSRPTHVFTMYPPDDDAHLSDVLSSVKLFIDDQFNGLIQAEFFGPDGDSKKKLSLSEFQKVDGYWIFGAVRMKNDETRDSTVFKVTDASLGFEWNDDLFAPQSLLENLPSERIYPKNTAFIEELPAQ